jgi:hypothetical protein
MHHYQVRNYSTGASSFEYVTENSKDVPDIWTSFCYFDVDMVDPFKPKKYQTRSEAKLVCDALSNMRKLDYMKHEISYKILGTPKPKWSVYKVLTKESTE